jgi:hypothetical protein
VITDSRASTLTSYRQQSIELLARGSGIRLDPQRFTRFAKRLVQLPLQTVGN